MNILDKAKSTAQKISKDKIELAEREIEEIKKRIIGEGERMANELRSQAAAKRERAVALLMKKFEGEVGDVKT